MTTPAAATTPSPAASGGTPGHPADGGGIVNGAKETREAGNGAAETLFSPGTPRMVKMMASPVVGEEHGGAEGVRVGLLTFVLTGCAVGSLAPKNDALPTPWYRTVSSCVGYAYFVCWAVSFYPQALTNYRRKTTAGLSADFCSLNVLGFFCYSAYNASLFFSVAVQQQYRARHGPDSEITVQSNDVAFAVHAFALSSLTLCQIQYYDGLAGRVSREVGAILLALVAVIIVALAMCVLPPSKVEFLDFLYLLSYVKILITLLKYLPQIVLNFRRKSTRGFSVWQILLDLAGGILSVGQLVMDCADLGDYSGLAGNLAKFLLGAVSVVLDAVILVQHYVWFPAPTESASSLAGRHHLHRKRQQEEDDEEEDRAVRTASVVVSPAGEKILYYQQQPKHSLPEATTATKALPRSSSLL